MALATRCPHCQTTFRVVHDQLKLRSGMVRCGNCQQIFNGIEHLIRANTPAAPTSPPPAPILADAPTTAPPPIILAKPPLPEIIPEAQPIVVMQPIAVPEPLPVAPEPLPVAPEPMPVASEPVPVASEPPPEPPEPLVAPPEQVETPAPASTAPIIEHNFPSEIISTSKIEPQLNEGHWEHTPQQLATAMAEPRLEDESPAAPDEASSEMEEPGFVKAGRRQQKWRRVWSLLQATACVLLITLLLGQSIYTWRDIIVLRWPASKIMVFNACTILGCKVGLPTQIHSLSIELGELQVLPRNKNTFSYSTALRNQSNLVQAWPHIELILTDGNDVAVARRVFTPADYLSHYTAASKGFAPQSDHPVKLYFEFLQLKAANYRAEIFYP